MTQPKNLHNSRERMRYFSCIFWQQFSVQFAKFVCLVLIIREPHVYNTISQIAHVPLQRYIKVNFHTAFIIGFS